MTGQFLKQTNFIETNRYQRIVYTRDRCLRRGPSMRFQGRW